MNWPHLIHRYEIVRDTGAHLYEQCRVCDHRRIRRVGGGLQPIDRKWRETGRWTVMRPAPKPERF